MQPQVGRIVLSHFIAPITRAKWQNAVDYAERTSGFLFADINASLTFTNGQAIQISSPLQIIGRSPVDKTIIDASQDAVSGVDFKVFTIDNNVKVSFENIEIKGAKTGYVTVASTYTLSGTTLTSGASNFVSNDAGRYIYLDSSSIKVRRLISNYTNATTVTISSGTSLDASGTYHFYRDNSNYGIYTTGSETPASNSITYSAGQKFVKTTGTLSQTYVDGYVYFTSNGKRYERQIS